MNKTPLKSCFDVTITSMIYNIFDINLVIVSTIWLPNVSESSYERITRPPQFHLRHSVSHCVSPATTQPAPIKPRMMQTVFGRRPVSFVSDYGIIFDDDADNFIMSPSIPMPHMPHSALKRQARKGWDTAHYPRHMSVNTGRDSIKYSQWNDISA